MTQKQSILRFLGYALSYGVFGAGFLMVITQKDKRALHELISGTRSVLLPKSPKSKSKAAKA